MLDSAHLKLWCLVLRWSFPLLSVYIYEPDFMHGILRALEGSEATERLEAVSTLRRFFNGFELHMYPIWKPAVEGSLGHWTLLRVSKAREVRYYESLEDMSSICSVRAQLVLEALDLGDQVLTRVNEFRQSSAECTEVTMRYGARDA